MIFKSLYIQMYHVAIGGSGTNLLLDNVAAQFFLKNVHPEMSPAFELFGKPKLNSRPNVFGELMRVLISPSASIEAAVLSVLASGEQPDITLHTRMLMSSYYNEAMFSLKKQLVFIRCLMNKLVAHWLMLLQLLKSICTSSRLDSVLWTRPDSYIVSADDLDVRGRDFSNTSKAFITEIRLDHCFLDYFISRCLFYATLMFVKPSPKRADISVEIVFPVSSDLMTNKKDFCNLKSSTVEDSSNLTVAPGVTSGDSPYMGDVHPAHT